MYAYNRLCYWRNQKPSSSAPYNDDITFVQGAEASNDTKKGPRDCSNNRCHICGELGHDKWEKKCPDLVSGRETLNDMANNEGNEGNSAGPIGDINEG